MQTEPEPQDSSRPLLERDVVRRIRHGGGAILFLDQWMETDMATGWAGDGAVQEQIDATVEDAIKRARSRLGHGPSLAACEECNAPIPQARRAAVPGVRLCVECQQAQDDAQNGVSGYNRRGSKDSQLR
ncbi:MAG TPA: DksA/TraR family C4-type zinc finger protein [Rubrivivax sp.]|nr:DksA/TraR family C4-type zinc finger protein [Rubrivivax sp.]